MIGGREDRIVAPKVVEWTAKRLGVAAHIYDDHAHWLLAEPAWQKIATDVADFLGRLPARAQAPLRRIA